MCRDARACRGHLRLNGFEQAWMAGASPAMTDGKKIMTDTPRLALPVIEAAQAQKHVTHNEALVLLDALVQLTIESRTLNGAA